jgi:imidazolonepropionase-like amidohydrolase
MLGEAQAWLDAGISIQQVIHAMTQGNARAYHIDQSLGSLTSGKDATFSVYDTNPVSDSFTTMAPNLVVVRGNVALTNEE